MNSSSYAYGSANGRVLHKRQFSNTARRKAEREPFHRRLRRALGETKIKWYPIPAVLGIGFLGLGQLYRVNEREKKARAEEEAEALLKYQQNGTGGSVETDMHGRKYKRKRIRPSGPWQVQIMSTLPLKAMSRLWGRFNELTIPYYLRVPGFKLYSWIFGVNLHEVAEPDLHVYPNLAKFFYRKLKPGVRPLDPNPTALLSPADGRVLQFGIIDNGEVEQVKGMTYSVDALLGTHTPDSSPNINSTSAYFPRQAAKDESISSGYSSEEEDVIKRDEEFANVNGISYTLPSLLSGDKESQKQAHPYLDASTESTAASVAEVRADLALGDKPWYDRFTEKKSALYYCVIYLAPGDYHRFHSPTSWVAEKRRHFAGELYSVSPYLQRTLPGLFTLNERVALLGRWRWGFFSMTPVGATNVGSIIINFDKELRTNSLLTDTAADRAAEEAMQRGEPYSGYSEATYEHASPILHGQALRRGEEMGGFQLGSTIVLVFEAPIGHRHATSEDKNSEDTVKHGGWNWNLQKGQRVKVGESLGWVDETQ